MNLNITPNYNLNYSRFNQKVNNRKVNNQQLQSNPSFGIKLNPGELAAAGGAVLTLTTMFLNPDTKVEEKVKTPTREELIDMVLKTEDGNGCHTFKSEYDAGTVVDLAAGHLKGLAKMLSMHDKYGNMRFLKVEDYAAAEVFETYPAEAVRLADEKDEMQNYRYKAHEIKQIIEEKHKKDYKPEYITLLKIKRYDQSPVYTSMPDNKDLALRAYNSDPENFLKAVNMRVMSRGNRQYIDPEVVPKIVPQLHDYPQATTLLLQLSLDQHEARFPARSIAANQDAPKLFDAAPITFMSLASAMNSSLSFDTAERFSLHDICTIMKGICPTSEAGTVTELSKEDLKAISELANIEVQNHKCKTHSLTGEEICKVFNNYKNYKEDTIYIMENYVTESSGRKNALIPDENDMALYQEDRDAFNAKYPKREVV